MGVNIFAEPNNTPVITKDKLLLGLVSNHTRVFSKEDLFSEPLQPQEWYRYLNEVKKFVAQNGKGDNKFSSALDRMLENNDALINSIKVAYNALFAPGGSYQENVAKSALQKFDQVATAMADLQKTIVKETYYYRSKKEVKEVLEQLALFIEMTARKAGNDLRKRRTKNEQEAATDAQTASATST